MHSDAIQDDHKSVEKARESMKFLCAAKGRPLDFNCMAGVIPRGDVWLTITGKPMKSDTVTKKSTLQSRRANEKQDLVLGPSMHSSVEAGSLISPLTYQADQYALK